MKVISKRIGVIVAKGAFIVYDAVIVYLEGGLDDYVHAFGFLSEIGETARRLQQV